MTISNIQKSSKGNTVSIRYRIEVQYLLYIQYLYISTGTLCIRIQKRSIGNTVNIRGKKKRTENMVG